MFQICQPYMSRKYELCHVLKDVKCQKVKHLSVYVAQVSVVKLCVYGLSECVCGQCVYVVFKMCVCVVKVCESVWAKCVCGQSMCMCVCGLNMGMCVP